MKVQYVKRGSIFSKSTTQRCMCSSSAKPTHTHANKREYTTDTQQYNVCMDAKRFGFHLI